MIPTIIFCAGLLMAEAPIEDSDTLITTAEYQTPGIVIEEPDIPVDFIPITSFNSGGCLTKQSGVYQGPSGKESYYNLNMGGCVRIMRDNGYSLSDYPYWVRGDGCKMFGDYIMVAMNTYIYPKGTIVETSLGTAIVVDHCVAAEWGTVAVDAAVTW